MKLNLINPPIDFGYKSSLRTGIYPPLNLAVLAGYVKRHSKFDLEVKLLDGEVDSNDRIRDNIASDIVAISCNVLNYKSAIEIAEVAREKGAKVLLGGPYAGEMAERILKNRNYIDAVVSGDGELALSKYISGEKYENIPNLIYRRSERNIQFNPYRKEDLNSLPMPDFCNLDLNRYFENHWKRYGIFKPYSGSLPIYSMKGCQWRDRSGGGCAFCMIPHYGVNYKKPEKYWEEIIHLKKLYNINHFWDVSDSFTENKVWMNEVLKKKPVGLDVSMQVYARPISIDEERVRLLKKIGVKEVFIGADSGDDMILRNSNKGILVRHVEKAVELLTKEDINVIVSFVLGLPGETPQTLQKTVDLAKSLSNNELINETSTSILFPIPGSHVFNTLMSVPGMKEKYSSDILDYEQIKRDWLMHFTKVSFELLEEALVEITNHFELNSNFSRPKEQVLSALDC